MGRELAEHFPVARDVFMQADRALGFSLSRLCFEGPAEELQRTANTQPAMLATSVATAEVLRSKGAKPDIVAGHSLGEYSALVVAGSLNLPEAVQLVRKRGEYMQEAVPVGAGAMAAVLGLDAEAVRQVCGEAAEGEIVSPANLNSPAQTVIAGHRAAVERAVELAKSRGAKRVALLNVSAPFHCALMQPAQEEVARVLAGIALERPRIPVAANVSGGLVATAEAARDALIRQVTGAVRWVDCVKALKAAGASAFVEVGPGKVLCGLLKQIDGELKSLNVEDAASLEKTLAELKGVA